MIAEKRISLQEIGLANVTNAIPLLSFSPPPPPFGTADDFDTPQSKTHSVKRHTCVLPLYFQFD